MSSGAAARREVRDALNTITIPDGMQAVHSQLIEMVEDAAAAMDAGYSGLSEANLPLSCDQRIGGHRG